LSAKGFGKGMADINHHNKQNIKNAMKSVTHIFDLLIPIPIK
jgi:hypothetical protein